MSQRSDEPRGVFDDFSFSAVAASALTAATSFLLTSKIGLAGSLIGAMIAAIISTVSTQVYKGMLLASADRIKEAAEPAVSGQHTANKQRFLHVSTHDVGLVARRLAIFAACVSLVAVLASAAVIALATRGAGLGPTTWEPVTVVEEADETVPATADTADTVVATPEAKSDEATVEVAPAPDAPVDSDETAEAPAEASTGDTQLPAASETANAEAQSQVQDQAPVEETVTEQ